MERIRFSYFPRDASELVLLVSVIASRLEDVISGVGVEVRMRE